MKSTRDAKTPLEPVTLIDADEEFSLSSMGVRAYELAVCSLETLGLLVGCSAPDRDTPVSEVAATLAEAIGALCARAHGVALFLESREALENDVRHALQSLATLRDFSLDAEARGLMPGEPKIGLADNGRSPSMLLAAIAQVASDLEASIREISEKVSDAEGAFGTRSPEKEEISQKIDKLVAPVRLEQGAAPPPQYAASTAGAMSAGISARPASQVEVARVVKSLDPSLHEKLMVRSSLVPARTDGTMVRVESALAAIEGRKPKIWKTIRGGDAISRSEPIASQADIEFDLRGVSRLEAGVPRGYALEAVEVRDRNGRPLDASVKLSMFGEVRFEPPEGAVSLLMRVEEGVGPDLRRDVVERLRSGLAALPAPLSRALAAALQAARAEPDIFQRAQLVAGAFKATDPIYTLEPMVAELIDSAGDSKLALLNGLNAGSCLTLSFQLANLLNAAGVPAIIDTGPYCDERRGAYFDSPGHAVVRCFVPHDLVFDPTLWTARESLDTSKVPVTRWRSIIDSVGELDPTEAYDLGRTLREAMKEEVTRAVRIGGHSLRDDLDSEGSSRAARIMRSHCLAEDVCSAWDRSLSSGSTRPLVSVWSKNVAAVIRSFGEPGKPEDEPARVLLDCIVAACNDRETYSPAERVDLLATVTNSFQSYGFSRDDSDFSPVLKVLDPILSGELECSPELADELLACLSSNLSSGPTDPKAANAWMQSAAAYCRILDQSPDPLLDSHRRLREIAAAYGEALAAEKILPETSAYVDAFASRFVSVMSRASMRPADLFLGSDDQGAMARGPRQADDAWRTIVTADPAVAKAFDRSGRPAPELVAELLERTVDLFARGETETAVSFLSELAEELGPNAVALSAHADRITEIARERLVPASALPYPGESRLSRLLFEIGASERREDLALAAIDALGGLDLSALEPSWPQTPSEIAVMSFVDSIASVTANGDRLSITGEYAAGAGTERRSIDGQGWLLYLSHERPGSFPPAVGRLAALLDVDPDRAASRHELALAELEGSNPDLFDALCHTVRGNLTLDARTLESSMLDALAAEVSDSARKLRAIHHSVELRFVTLYEAGGRTSLSAANARSLIGSALDHVSSVEATDPSAVSEALRRANEDLALSEEFEALPNGEKLILLNLARREWEHALKRHGSTRSVEDDAVLELIGYGSTPYGALFMDELVSSHPLYGQRSSGSDVKGKEYAARLELAHAELEAGYAPDPDRVAEALREALQSFPRSQPTSATKSLSSHLDHRGSSPSPSRTDDFRGYRRYQPGDDPRLVDYRAYARTDKLLVREFNAGMPREAEEIVLHVDAEALASDGDQASSNIALIHRFLAEAIATKRPAAVEVSHRGSTLCRLSKDTILSDFQHGKTSGELPGQALFESLWRIGIAAMHHPRIYDRGSSLEGTAVKGPEPRSGRALHVYACHPRNLAATLKERGSVTLLRGIADTSPVSEPS